MARWLTVVAVCGLTLAAGAAVAQECPEIVATLPMGYPDAGAADVLVDGTVAVVPGAAGVSVLDLCDPLDPRVVGQVELDPPASEIAFSDSYLYVVQGVSLRVFDLTDPSLPVEVGSTPLPGVPYDLAVAGTLLHLVDEDGLRVVNVSTPAAPQIVGLLAGDYAAVAASGSYAYPGYGFVSWGALAGTFDVVDVSSPGSPALIGQVPTVAPDFAQATGNRLLVLGEHGLLGQLWPGLDVFDLGDPSSPEWIFSPPIFLDGEPLDAGQRGQLVFVSGQPDSRVRAYDILLPNFSETAWVELPDPRGLDTLGRFLLVADQTLGLVVLDTTCVGGMFSDGFESGDTGAWSEVWP